MDRKSGRALRALLAASVTALILVIPAAATHISFMYDPPPENGTVTYDAPPVLVRGKPYDAPPVQVAYTHDPAPRLVTAPDAPPVTACSDGLDNDGDSLVDLDDPGCVDAGDDDEFNAPPPSEPVFTTNIVDGQEIALPYQWTASTAPDADSIQFWADGTLLEQDATVPFGHDLALAPGTHDLGLCAWFGAERTCYNLLGGGKFATVTILGSAPPPVSYTYRFATFDPATDDVTGALNRFQPSYSWWVPGSAEGALWPNGGGIFPVSHPTYGPGLNMVLDDDMLYGNVAAGTGPRDSNIVRFMQDPSIIGDSRLVNPPPGSTHTWEATIMRPTSATWPVGQYESVWEAFYTLNGASNVGHHIFLQRDYHYPGFTYYFGKQNAAGSWTRYNSGLPFNVGDFHSLRWEIKWSDVGVANGSIKVWTSINGGAPQQWLNLENIATKPAGFGSVYGYPSSIRTPTSPAVLVHPNLSLHVYNLRVSIN